MQHHDATSVGNVCSETIGTGDRYWSPKQGTRPLSCANKRIYFDTSKFLCNYFKKNFSYIY